MSMSPRKGGDVLLSSVQDAIRLEAFQTAWQGTLGNTLPRLNIEPGCDPSFWGDSVKQLQVPQAAMVLDAIKLPCKVNKEDPIDELLKILGIVQADDEAEEELPPWHVVLVCFFFLMILICRTIFNIFSFQLLKFKSKGRLWQYALSDIDRGRRYVHLGLWRKWTVI